jgi:hypothetical protein
VTIHSRGPAGSGGGEVAAESRKLPLAWAIALGFALASLVGILALTSDLADTDAVLAEGVGQVVKIDTTTTRGLLANDAPPPTDAAVQGSAPPVLATADSLRRANAALTTLAAQVRTLADVLAGANAPLAATISTADRIDHVVRRANTPTGDVIDTLGAIDRQVTGLGPALDRTLRLSRSIEAELHILGHPPLR